MKKYITINGNNYMYYEPSSYEYRRKLLKRIKSVKEKIRARETGYLKGKNDYVDYPELLLFLEKLI